MMHSVLAAIQPIVFVCNVKVRHAPCNMYAVIKTIIFYHLVISGTNYPVA